MLYKAIKDGKIEFQGNKIFEKKIIDLDGIDKKLLENRVERVKKEKYFFHLNEIDNGVFYAAIEYFKGIGANWTNLPLTTLMISSPGEVYAGQTLDYTTDTLPLELPNWFGKGKRIFLSESSQFYLELYLLINGLDQVFSVYNSFRKEESDITHLSEFQHIEYEGKNDLDGIKKIFLGLFEYIFEYLYKNNKENLLYFISEKDLDFKRDLVKKGPKTISFKDALSLLYKETGNNKYKKFSLKYFGSWEEVKLTEILGANVIIEKYPMLQIPFYHALLEDKIDGVPVAKNADFILYGYRETIGAGERIKSKEVLLKKAEIFNLPKEDYLPYLQTRDFIDYEITSGFGLGWQRLTQWLTNQPYIYEATVFPRTHLTPNP